MELKGLKIGDVVMAKIQWKREGIFSTAVFDILQRGIIEELNENSAKLRVSVPGRYEWITKYISKENIIDRVKHGRDNNCCRNCTIGFDDNCGFYSAQQRKEARDFIERIENDIS